MRVGSATLWAGVLLGPAAWLSDLGLSYALVPARHGDGTLRARLAVAGLAFAITVASGLLSLRNWRRLRSPQPAPPPAQAHARPDEPANGPAFLAAFGAIASALFALIIVTMAIPNFVIHPNATPTTNQSAWP
ncbi:MAG TPA: hypothetical protein VHM31_18290 [Polyangia bacterium]|nr:hypothetical protein [Polyangia bacterium]